MNRRTLAGLALCLSLVVANASPVSATASGFISPASQYHAHGVASHWSTGWGQVAPYDQYFCYGDGTPCVVLNNTTLTSRGYSHTFYPCQYKNFTQTLYVKELSTGSYGYAFSSAAEGGGSPC